MENETYIKMNMKNIFEANSKEAIWQRSMEIDWLFSFAQEISPKKFRASKKFHKKIKELLANENFIKAIRTVNSRNRNFIERRRNHEKKVQKISQELDKTNVYLKKLRKLMFLTDDRIIDSLDKDLLEIARKYDLHWKLYKYMLYQLAINYVPKKNLEEIALETDPSIICGLDNCICFTKINPNTSELEVHIEINPTTTKKEVKDSWQSIKKMQKIIKKKFKITRPYPKDLEKIKKLGELEKKFGRGYGVDWVIQEHLYGSSVGKNWGTEEKRKLNRTRKLRERRKKYMT